MKQTPRRTLRPERSPALPGLTQASNIVPYKRSVYKSKLTIYRHVGPVL
jgi:hypothetical protein